MNRLVAYFSSYQTGTFDFAVKSGNYEVVEKLLQRGISKYIDLTEALHIASMQDYVSTELITVLLKYGAIIKENSVKNICKKKLNEILKIFILSRNNHDGENFPYEYLLCVMCQRNELELVTILLKEGAETNIFNGYPLLFAVYNNNYEMVARLIKYGANKNIFFIDRKEFSVSGLAQLPNASELVCTCLDLMLLKNKNDICILDYFNSKSVLPEIIDLIKEKQ